MPHLEPNTLACPVCDSACTWLTSIHEPAKGETILRWASSGTQPARDQDQQINPNYQRDIWRCPTCHHLINDAGWSRVVGTPSACVMPYTEHYWTQTYADQSCQRFKAIMRLPPDQSDNHQRCVWVNAVLKRHLAEKTLCDIGAGLGVFCATMQSLGWCCVALDPDSRATKLITKQTDIPTINGWFPSSEALSKIKNYHFNLISAVKVLEHVPHPKEFVRSLIAISRTQGSGWMLIEVPDAGAASQISFATRQEFFSEHCQGFCASSLTRLLKHCGATVTHLLALTDPSGKLTLRVLARACSVPVRPPVLKRDPSRITIPRLRMSQPEDDRIPPLADVFESDVWGSPVWRKDFVSQAVAHSHQHPTDTVLCRLKAPLNKRDIQTLAHHGFVQASGLITYRWDCVVKAAPPNTHRIRRATGQDEPSILAITDSIQWCDWARNLRGIAFSQQRKNRWMGNVLRRSRPSLCWVWVNHEPPSTIHRQPRDHPIRNQTNQTNQIAQNHYPMVGGFISVTVQERLWRVDLIGVAPWAQGQGIAHQLLSQTTAHARTMDGRSLSASTDLNNTSARRVYQQWGEEDPRPHFTFVRDGR